MVMNTGTTWECFGLDNVVISFGAFFKKAVGTLCAIWVVDNHAFFGMVLCDILAGTVTTSFFLNGEVAIVPALFVVDV